MQKAEDSEELTKAVELFQAGSQGKALQLVENIVAADASNLAAWQALGLMAVQSARTEDGIKALRRASELAPFDAGIYANLGQAYFKIADLPRAEACIRSARALDPSNPDIGKLLVHVEHIFGNRHASTDKYAKSDDVDAEVNYKKALTFQSLDSTDGVIEHLRIVVRILPAFAAAHKSLADFFWHASELRSLIAEFNSLLGQSGEDTGDTRLAEEAEAHYRDALYHDPDLAEASAYFGNVTRRMGNLSEAVDQYRQAANSRPANAVTQANFASALLELGELEEAKIHAELALELEPEFAEAGELRGHVLLALGDGAAAADQYLNAFKFDPKVSSELFT